jgi:hypothetical protein
VGYQLSGLITRIDAFVDAPQHLRTVALNQDLGLLPVTDDVVDELGGRHENLFEPIFFFLARGVAALAEQLSQRAPVAYCEVELGGGDGTQAAVVWDAATIVLGPVVHELGWNEPDSPREQWPINAALMALGAVRGNATDPFEAVGLGRHRFTEDWLSDSTVNER